MFGTTLHMANRDAAFVRGREAKAAATRAERPRLEQLVTATGMDDALEPVAWGAPVGEGDVQVLPELLALARAVSKLPLDAGTAEAIEDAALLDATERLDQLQAATEAELAPRVLKPTAEPAGAPTPAKIMGDKGGGHGGRRGGGAPAARGDAQ